MKIKVKKTKHGDYQATCKKPRVEAIGRTEAKALERLSEYIANIREAESVTLDEGNFVEIDNSTGRTLTNAEWPEIRVAPDIFSYRSPLEKVDGHNPQTYETAEGVGVFMPRAGIRAARGVVGKSDVEDWPEGVDLGEDREATAGTEKEDGPDLPHEKKYTGDGDHPDYGDLINQAIIARFIEARYGYTMEQLFDIWKAGQEFDAYKARKK